MAEIDKSTILQSLTLLKDTTKKVEESKFVCIFCNFEEKDEKKILQHLFFDHKLIISDVQEITDLEEYLNFWKEHFKGKDPAEYCTTMLWRPDVNSEESEYFLLSDIVVKDKEIRKIIQTKMIEKALTSHQFERSDTNFKRGCLYCRHDIEPTTRYVFVEHLYGKHFFQLGKPENLVFIDKLIDMLEEKLTNLICIYCEKVFKDRATLKEHMRKKGHKKINASNKAYDKFYIVNYKIKEEPTVIQERKYYNPLRERQLSQEDEIFENDDTEWSEWSDANEEVTITCLFCSHQNSDFNEIISHMRDSHDFNFEVVTERMNFYQKVKIVNFIRRKIHLKQCLSCEENFKDLENLLAHLKQQNHLRCNEKFYDRAEYFFPTFEDDSFLCQLDNFNETDDTMSEESFVVISEDSTVSVNKDAEMLSREKFMDI